METAAIQYKSYNNNLAILNELIETQRKSFKQFIIFSFVIVTIGIITLLSGLAMTDTALKTIVASAGTFVTTLSGFSFKEFFNKKGNIKTYSTMRLKIELNREDESEQTNIKGLLESIIIKNL